MQDTGMRVSELWRYPVKSVAGERLDTTAVGPLGIDGDRAFGLVDLDTGLVLTARRIPDLLFVSVLDIGVDGRPLLRLPDGLVTSDDAELSEWLGRRVALRQPDVDERGQYEIAVNDDQPTSEWIRWQGPKGVFHDSNRTRLSIISDEALGDWDVRRFRPNVVISGGDERDLLDQTIHVGSVTMAVIKEIDRCVIVTRPQPDLDRDKDVLVRVHQSRDGNFGIGALVTTTGTISVGDPVHVV